MPRPGDAFDGPPIAGDRPFVIEIFSTMVADSRSDEAGGWPVAVRDVNSETAGDGFDHQNRSAARQSRCDEE